MQPTCTSMLAKFYPCKNWVLHRVSFQSECRTAFTRLGPHLGCRVVFPKPDGWLDEVLHEHAGRGLFIARPKAGEGVGHFIVSSEDIMKFKTIELHLELSYLQAVWHHVGVVVV
jgi:hypothetical protein